MWRVMVPAVVAGALLEPATAAASRPATPAEPATIQAALALDVGCDVTFSTVNPA
jgi:hypothetical protein